MNPFTPGEPVEAMPPMPPPRPMLGSPPVFGGNMPAQPTTWPMVVGVIAIIIASLGILSNGCGGIVGPVMQTQMSKLAPAGSNPILLCAGIGSVRRRPWARRAAMTWAWLRIVVTVPASYVGYQIAADTMRMMVEASNSGTAGTKPLPAGMTSFFQIFGAFGIAIGAVLVCAFPIFTLIWFSRSRIRSEIATWSSPAQA